MTKYEAQKRGKALLKKVKGRGWKLSVSMVGGCSGNYHYSLYLPLGGNFQINLHESFAFDGDGCSYWTLMGEGFSGKPEWYLGGGKSFDDPNEAVDVQFAYAAKVVAEATVAIFAGIEALK
jgi:hypothetical protein